MKLTFNVGRAAAIRGGINDCGKRERDIDVSVLSQEDRDLLAEFVHNDGTMKTAKLAGGTSWVDVEADAPTAAALVAGIRRAVASAAARDAEDRAKADRELAEVDAADARTLAEKRVRPARHNSAWTQVEPDHYSYTVLNYAKGREAELKVRNSPEWDAWLEEIAARNAALKGEFEANKAANEKAAAEKKAAKAAEEKAAKGRLAAWVDTHGSELARLRKAEGYDCWVSAARDEYAAAAAGRVVAGLGLSRATCPDGYDCATSEPRECPTVAEIKTLVAAREAAGREPAEFPASVMLSLVSYTPGEDDGGYDDRDPISRCELLVTIGGLPGSELDLDFAIPAE